MHHETKGLLLPYCYTLYYSRQEKSTLTSAPGTTRTCDLGIRRPLLYPPELRRQCAGQFIQWGSLIGFACLTHTNCLSSPRLPVIACAWIHVQQLLVFVDNRNNAFA